MYPGYILCCSTLLMETSISVSCASKQALSYEAIMAQGDEWGM